MNTTRIVTHFAPCRTFTYCGIAGRWNFTVHPERVTCKRCLKARGFDNRREGPQREAASA